MEDPVLFDQGWDGITNIFKWDFEQTVRDDPFQMPIPQYVENWGLEDSMGKNIG